MPARLAHAEIHAAHISQRTSFVSAAYDSAGRLPSSALTTLDVRP
jgi:hypothetical protein